MIYDKIINDLKKWRKIDFIVIGLFLIVMISYMFITPTIKYTYNQRLNLVEYDYDDSQNLLFGENTYYIVGNNWSIKTSKDKFEDMVTYSQKDVYPKIKNIMFINSNN